MLHSKSNACFELNIYVCTYASSSVSVINYLQLLLNKLGICQICVILSDLWSFFSKAKLSATKLQPLGFSPSAEILRSFWKLCEYRLTAAGEYYAALLLAFTKDLLTFSWEINNQEQMLQMMMMKKRMLRMSIWTI